MELKQQLFLTLTREQQRKTVEALIFSSEDVINTSTLTNILLKIDVSEVKKKSDDFIQNPNFENDEYDVNESELEEPVDNLYISKNIKIPDNFFNILVDEINTELLETDRPYRIVDYAGGWQFATRSEYGNIVQKLIKSRTKRRLSQAALETLAIIAYRQPVTKPEIDQIRGTNTNEVVNSLLEKNLVKIAGRKEVLGKPLLYCTTQEFLKLFGITNLKDLPKQRELEELIENMNELNSPKDEFVITVSDGDLLDNKDIKAGIFVQEINDEVLNEIEQDLSDNEEIIQNKRKSGMILLDDGTYFELEDTSISNEEID